MSIGFGHDWVTWLSVGWPCRKDSDSSIQIVFIYAIEWGANVTT